MLSPPRQLFSAYRYVKVDTGAKKILAFLGKKKKDYVYYLDDGGVLELCDLQKSTTLKGCQARAAENIPNKKQLELLNTP